MAFSDQALICIPANQQQVMFRTTHGPSSFIGKTYSKLGVRFERAAGKLCTMNKIGPEFPTKDLDNAFSGDPELKLKQLCDVYAFYTQKQQTPPMPNNCDWEVGDLVKYCSRLIKYASPTKSIKTQLEAFKSIVRLTTSYPGLRLAFLRDPSLRNINLDIIWKRQDDGWMDEEWRLFRHLAASCIGNQQLEVIRVVEGITPAAFGTFYPHSKGIVEKFLAIAVDTVLTDGIQRMTAIRYLGGILQMRPFWIENRNQGMPGEKLLRGSVVLVENLGLDPSMPNPSRNILSTDVEGIDILIQAVLVGVRGWAMQITPLQQDAAWLQLAFKLLDILDGLIPGKKR
ncbi:hypothetical protein BU17DRAFT_101613 [Hysterangium stoloniferum]|nr:hypothetical protein BU17DRAFT_101613 [Hysterangium stoloniferum]